MAEITAAMVRDLRDATGAGMMDCKKALTETGGDMEAAIDWLRKKGLSAAAKKSGRVAAEGVGAQLQEQRGAADRVGLHHPVHRPQRGEHGGGARVGGGGLDHQHALGRTAGILQDVGQGRFDLGTVAAALRADRGVFLIGMECTAGAEPAVLVILRHAGQLGVAGAVLQGAGDGGGAGGLGGCGVHALVGHLDPAGSERVSDGLCKGRFPHSKETTL